MITAWESRIGAVVYGTHGGGDHRLTQMSVEIRDDVTALSDFVARAVVPSEARARAATAFKDTIGVMLAGVAEPAARIAQSLATEEGAGECRVLGTSLQTGPGFAAFANGVAAHALDYDDMCFVSLAACSCPRSSPRARSRSRPLAPFSMPTSSASSSSAGSAT